MDNKDWKLEVIEQLIKIEEGTQEKTTITMDYVNYLWKIKKFIEYGIFVGKRG